MKPVNPIPHSIGVRVCDHGGSPDSERSLGSLAARLFETGDARRVHAPLVAFDTDGHAVVAWFQSDGVGTQVGISRFVGGAWSKAQPLEIPNGHHHLLGPQLAFDGSGNGLAVWNAFDGARFNLMARRCLAGRWSDATPFEILGENDLLSLDVAAAPNGDAVVIWRRWDDTRSSLWASRYCAVEGRWSAGERVAIDNCSGLAPQATCDARGNAIVMWQRFDDDRFEIVANHFVAGIGWGNTVHVTRGRGPALEPRLVVDAQGNATAVWSQYDGTCFNVVGSRYVAGTGWGKPEALAHARGDALEPCIAADRNGNAIVVWEQFDGERDCLWTNRYVTATGWGKAERVWIADQSNAFDPQVTMDAHGNAIAVWLQFDGTHDNVWTNRYVAGAGWGEAEQIESAKADGILSRVAMAPAGDAVAAWRYFDCPGIWSSRYVANNGWSIAERIDASATWTGQVGIDDG